MTVSGAIIHWLTSFHANEAGKILHIDTELMHGNVDYALVKEPVRNVKESVLGDKTITDHYTLQARLPNATNADSVDNNEFMEVLERWVEKCDAERNYPEIPDGTATSIGISTPFFVGMNGQDYSIYQMTISVVYEK